MGMISGVVLVHLLLQAETKTQTKGVIIGYILASPIAFLGALVGGLHLPPAIGTIIYGGLPLILGSLVGYVVTNRTTQ
jgi:hypothetical protein